MLLGMALALHFTKKGDEGFGCVCLMLGFSKSSKVQGDVVETSHATSILIAPSVRF